MPSHEKTLSVRGYPFFFVALCGDSDGLTMVAILGPDRGLLI